MCFRSSNSWQSGTGSVYGGQSGTGSVYGGQIIGQALVAAGHTVAAHLHVHSMHCYFLLKGNVIVPSVLFHVLLDVT